MKSTDKFLAQLYRALLVAMVLLAFAGCATVPPRANADANMQIAAFSRVPAASFSADSLVQSAWQPWVISRFNRRTTYQMVDDNGVQVLRAFSNKAASGLVQDVLIDPQATPYLRWRWKVPKLLAGADLATRGADDSPVRIIVSFEGDHEKLDVEDRSMASMVKLFSGRDMPYAALMYVWDNKLPIDVMFDNAHSGRAKMVVVESGEARVGQWLNFRRNLLNDFQRAFGEAPGKIISVAVMTDSNRTETEAIAYYGDIVLEAAP